MRVACQFDVYMLPLSQKPAETDVDAAAASRFKNHELLKPSGISTSTEPVRSK